MGEASSILEDVSAHLLLRFCWEPQPRGLRGTHFSVCPCRGAVRRPAACGTFKDVFPERNWLFAQRTPERAEDSVAQAFLSFFRNCVLICLLQRISDLTGLETSCLQPAGSHADPGSSPVLPGSPRFFPGSSPVLPRFSPVLPRFSPVLPRFSPVLPWHSPCRPAAKAPKGAEIVRRPWKILFRGKTERKKQQIRRNHGFSHKCVET